MSWLQFWAAVLPSLAWPLAAIICVFFLRPAIIALFNRTSQLAVEIGGQKASWKALEPLARSVASVIEGERPRTEDTVPGDRTDVDHFSWSRVLEKAATEPVEAIVQAWRRLVSTMDEAADRVGPQVPHGWPAVTVALAAWDQWPTVEPVVAELARLRDATAAGQTTPEAGDAIRYVTLARNVATAIGRYHLGAEGRTLTEQRESGGPQ